MEEKKITLQNVKSFLEGTIRKNLNRFNVLPAHIKEQVAYRESLCKDDCAKVGKCKFCGCSVPGKWFSNTSCNKGERFPNLMDKDSWEKFKKENNIKINES